MIRVHANFYPAATPVHSTLEAGDELLLGRPPATIRAPHHLQIRHVFVGQRFRARAPHRLFQVGELGEAAKYGGNARVLQDEAVGGF